MFSGKSTRLIQHIRAFNTLEYKIFCVKPDNDIRYTTTSELCTHNQEKESCHVIPIDKLESIYDIEECKHAQIIIIEEGQFFTNLFQAVQYLMDHCKKHIYISALNGDSNRNPFGDIMYLLPLASHVEWMTALCKKCKDGTAGIYSKAKITLPDQVHVGSSQEYEAVCLEHYLHG